MMNKKRRNRRHGVPLAAYLMLILLVSTLMASTTVARYAVTGEVSDSARVAMVVLDGMTNSLYYPVAADEHMEPGQTMEVTFEVKNHRDNKVSEVAQGYSIVISDENNLPLSYELVGENITGTGTIPQKEGETDTYSGGVMNPSVESTHTYTLKATWDEARTESYLADEIDLITVTVNAEQID